MLSDYSQTKSELKARAENEEKLKNKGIPDPPSWLNNRQKEIFYNIINLLKYSDILCLNDVYILQTIAIALERLEKIEQQINDDIELIKDKGLSTASKKYTSDFFRCCNELCLSPQSRAKVANITQMNSTKNPLESLINELK